MRAFLLALLMIFLPAVAFAQQDTQPGLPAGITQEDAQAIQEAAATLRDYFNIDTVAQAPADTIVVEGRQTTVADVMDEGLEMLKTAVATTAAALEEIAPEVWRIMVRQQYAKAFADLIVPVFLFMAVLIWHLYMRKKWHPKEEPGDIDNDEWTDGSSYLLFVNILPAVIGFITFWWGAVRFATSIKYLINPEYYAIRDLFMLILNRGQAPM